jgi:hypothetical protein
MYHADLATGRVAGTIVIKPSGGHWEDVLLFADP